MDSDTSNSELSEINHDREENHVYSEFIRGAREWMQKRNGGNVLFPARRFDFDVYADSDSDTSEEEIDEPAFIGYRMSRIA